MEEHKLSRRLSDGYSARMKEAPIAQGALSLSLLKSARIAGGIFLAIILLLPLFSVPGLVIFVLPSEVYLIDWVHSQRTKSLVKTSLFDRSSETEYDFEEAEKGNSTISRSRHLEFTG
jgi:hypothetical protein